MRLTHLFTKTTKQAPADEVSKNAQLLIRAGFVHKEMAGAYTFLPLGHKVLHNIIGIVREEMNAIGGQEIELTSLQDKTIWEQSDRWSDEAVDVWFKTQLQNGTDVGLGFTHEEPITRMMSHHIDSYKDLPRYAYQFQKKFRNEVRAKSGVMRTREFIMKDLYSFSRNQAEHDAFYEKSKVAYAKVFERLGIGDETFLTFASGGSFSKYSHEFQTLTDAGEDTIYVDRNKRLAVNEEVFTDEVLADLELNRDDLEEHKAAEVGNIFSLGTKFSDAIGLHFTDEDGTQKPVIMGSYGIGPARVMGVITELMSDDRGLVWPENVAPAKVHLVCIGDDETTVAEADKLYETLTEKGVEVLYDDRNLRVGEMLGDADLIGIPHRVIVSEKSLSNGGVEVKKRTDADSSVIPVDQLVSQLA